MAMRDNNVTRKSVLDRLNGGSLDEIIVVEEEGKESNKDCREENLIMVKSCTEKRVSTTTISVKVIIAEFGQLVDDSFSYSR